MATAGGATSKVGSGGMITKIRAARVLMVAGITMVICHGRKPDALSRLIEANRLVLVFVAQKVPHDITPRKLWIALGDSAKGVIEVDQGAKRALVKQGSSPCRLVLFRLKRVRSGGYCRYQRHGWLSVWHVEERVLLMLNEFSART